MKIYVVTQGIYSDYHIITATTDEEVANKIAKKFSDDWDKADVEVYEDAERYLKTIYYVCFETNGDICEVHNKGNDCHEIEYALGFGNCWTDDNERFNVKVFADNEEQAVKIASEKRAEFLARKAGIA